MNKFNKIFPEKNIGGFSRYDITLTFYLFLNQVIKSDHIVVDLGAGRGGQFESQKNPFVQQLQIFKGRCKKIIGIDVDEAVLSNKYMDETIVYEASSKLPFEDNSIDVIYSDWVLEHIENPKEFVSEVFRVLKPGGWFCAKTPNKWGVIGIAGSLIPNSLHNKVISVLQPDRKDEDIFPTFHRMNSIGQIKRHFSRSSWFNFSFVDGQEVGYFSNYLIPAWFCAVYNKLMPSRLGLVLFAFVQKKDEEEIK